MPLNASGLLQRVHDWAADRDASIKIQAERMDAAFDNIIDAVNQLIQGQINFKGALKTVFGTAAQPAYTFAEDDDTGLARTAANTVAAVAGGTVSALFTSLGPAFADGKLIKDYIAEQVAPKADATAVNASLALKADQATVDAALALKADQTALTAGLAPKADTAAVNASLALKADQADVDLKADRAATSSALALKADTTYVDDQIDASKAEIVQTHFAGTRFYPPATIVLLDVLDTTITPKSATTPVRVTASITHDAVHEGMLFLQRDGVEIGSPAAAGARPVGISALPYDQNQSSTMATAVVDFVDVPGTTDPVTYRIGVRSLGTHHFPLNRTHDDPDHNQYERGTSRMILQQF